MERTVDSEFTFRVALLSVALGLATLAVAHRRPAEPTGLPPIGAEGKMYERPGSPTFGPGARQVRCDAHGEGDDRG